MQNIALNELHAFLDAQKKLEKANKQKQKKQKQNKKQTVRTFTLVPKNNAQKQLWERHITPVKSKKKTNNKARPKIKFY